MPVLSEAKTQEQLLQELIDCLLLLQLPVEKWPFKNPSRRDVLIYVKNFAAAEYKLQIDLNLPQAQIAAQLNRFSRLLEETIRQGKGVGNIPTGLPELVKASLEHQEEIRQAALERLGLNQKIFEEMVAEIQEGLGQKDRMGETVAWQSALDAAARLQGEKGEKAVDPETLRQILAERSQRAGRPAPTPQQVQSIARDIQDNVADLRQPKPLVRPSVSAGAPPAQKVVAEAQKLAAAGYQTGQAATAARETYSKALKDAVAPVIVKATKPAKHLEEATAVNFTKTIEQYLSTLSQGDLAKSEIDFSAHGPHRWRLEALLAAEAKKNHVRLLRDNEFDELVESVVAVKLPVSAVATSSAPMATPEEIAELERRFPGHLYQVSIWKSWFYYQVFKRGKERIGQELDKSITKLEQGINTKQTDLQKLRAEINDLERFVRTKEPLRVHEVYGRLENLKLRLVETERGIIETQKLLEAQKIQHEIIAKQMSLRDIDLTLARLRGQKGQEETINLLMEKYRAVFDATHSLRTNEVSLSVKQAQGIVDSLVKNGYGDSEVVSLAQGLLAQAKKQGRAHLHFDHFLEMESRTGQTPSALIELKKLFFRPNGLGQTMSRFSSRNPVFWEKIGFAPKSLTVPNGLIRKLTGRYASLSHFGSVAYEKTLGRLLATFAKTGLGKSINAGLTRAAIWLAARLGIELSLAAAGAPATAGLSLLLMVLWKAAKKLWDKFKGLLARIKKNPEQAIIPIIFGGLMFAFLPMPFSLLGLLPIIMAGGVLAGLGLGALGAGLGGFGAGVTGFFTALLAAPSGAGVGLLVVGTLGGLALLTLLVIIITAGAFVLPVLPGEIAPSQEYFTVYKSVSDKEIANDELPTYVDYQIRIEANEEIIISSIVDRRIISCQGTPPALPQTVVNFPPPSEPVTSLTIPENPGDYRLRFDDPDAYQDCRICNTVTVVASLADGSASGLRGSDSVCVSIGDPPEDCPEGWPTDHGRITQGPLNSYSHQNQEAIDIGSVRSYSIYGKEVHSTHAGRVTAVGYNTCGGYTVLIEGTCETPDGPVPFASRFYHLRNATVLENTEIPAHHTIGYVGGLASQDSCSTGPHLHYEFISHSNELRMERPWIDADRNEIEGCPATQACNLSW